jgi:hypothetical protein
VNAILATPVRAPRLTDKLLTEDLPCLLKCAEEEIDYLASRLKDEGHFAMADCLRPRFEQKLASLRRSHTWLQGKIAAEAIHRAVE